MPHSIEETSFNRPTYCDHCQGLLWGFIRQGVKCSDCGIISHHGCQKDIAPCKNEKLSENMSTHHTDSPAAKSLLRTLQKQPASSNIQAIPTPNNHTSSFTKVKKMVTSEEFQDMLVSAAIHSTDTNQPTNEYLANLPPLNPQNTAKNFSRFVSRCGPMFAFRDNVILLLSWNKPLETLTALLIYCLICLHPKLALFIPYLILFEIIISRYNKRFENDKKNNESKPNEQRQTDSLKPRKSHSASTATTGATVNSSTNRFSFTNSIFPAASDEASPEYLKNMQNLQNMMGEMSDLYDLIASMGHYVDWSSEKVTMQIFQTALISFFSMSIVIWFIPLNIICLVAGLSLFLLNTRFAKFVLKEMLPQLAEIGQSQLNSVVQWYSQIEKKMDDQMNTKELSLYENQRWWSGSGFIPHTLPNERGLWTDMSGAIEFKHKEELSAPKGYHWVEDNWTLDTTGPWVNEALGIEVAVIPENGGWVYTDNNWENPRNGNAALNDRMTSLTDSDKITEEKHVTRRRKWIRKCERNLPDKK
ncbi:MAG: integral peroxisomal membrane peroxin-domain-containing protein [Benjaminiella poitrasii]|nr:MAG: integral peroxisomal membrane peroxin-domain-containing protein [Benjaminiella poitrasii]